MSDTFEEILTIFIFWVPLCLLWSQFLQFTKIAVNFLIQKNVPLFKFTRLFDHRPTKTKQAIVIGLIGSLVSWNLDKQDRAPEILSKSRLWEGRLLLILRSHSLWSWWTCRPSSAKLTWKIPCCCVPLEIQVSAVRFFLYPRSCSVSSMTRIFWHPEPRMALSPVALPLLATVTMAVGRNTSSSSSFYDCDAAEIFCWISLLR